MKNRYLYAKWKGKCSYKAFDIAQCTSVTRLIYATIMEDNEENRAKLQRTADMNKELALSFQLRDQNGKITFQTK